MFAVFSMTRSSNFRQTLHDGLHFPHDQLGNQLVMQLHKQVLISRQISAIEQRNRELDILGIELIAFRESAGCGTQFHPQVPEFLRKPANAIPVFLLGAAISVKKKNVNVGVREKPSPSKSADGNERKDFRARLRLEKLFPSKAVAATSSTRFVRWAIAARPSPLAVNSWRMRVDSSV